MKAYLQNRAFSLGIPLVLVLVGGLVWPDSPTEHWRFLVFVTMALGFMHFFLGFYYQIKGFTRQPNFGLRLLVFVVLTLLSLLVCLWFIVNNQIGLLSVFGIIYFTFHGTLNEKTLLLMEAGVNVTGWYFLAFSLAFLAAIYSSLTHPSFFFDSGINFFTTDLNFRESFVVGKLGTEPIYVMVFFLLSSLLFLSLLYFKEVLIRRLLLVTIALVAVVGVVFYLIYPLNYVYIYHIYLSYHFIIWSVVYFRKYKSERPQLVRGYVVNHCLLLLLSLVLVLSVYAAGGSYVKEFGLMLFNMAAFATLSTIHISTSFMNEPWFKKLLS